MREGLAEAVALSRASGLLDVEDDERENAGNVEEDAGEAAVVVPAE